jgi:hypothetical protein
MGAYNEPAFAEWEIEVSTGEWEHMDSDDSPHLGRTTTAKPHHDRRGAAGRQA